MRRIRKGYEKKEFDLNGKKIKIKTKRNSKGRKGKRKNV